MMLNRCSRMLYLVRLEQNYSKLTLPQHRWNVHQHVQDQLISYSPTALKGKCEAW